MVSKSKNFSKSWILKPKPFLYLNTQDIFFLNDVKNNPVMSQNVSVLFLIIPHYQVESEGEKKNWKLFAVLN